MLISIAWWDLAKVTDRPQDPLAECAPSLGEDPCCLGCIFFVERHGPSVAVIQTLIGFAIFGFSALFTFFGFSALFAFFGFSALFTFFAFSAFAALALGR